MYIGARLSCDKRLCVRRKLPHHRAKVGSRAVLPSFQEDLTFLKRAVRFDSSFDDPESREEELVHKFYLGSN